MTNRAAETLVLVDVCGRTHPGRERADNQDNLLIADLSVAPESGGYSLHGEAASDATAERFTLGCRGALMLVADGMGGAAGGAMASALAVSHVYHDVMSSWAVGVESSMVSFARSLRDALERANAGIFEAAQRDPLHYGMGATATLAGVLGDVIVFAQVGDSRAYAVRERTAVQVTRDQSLVQELIDAGQMTQEQAEHSVNSNRILQALGPAPTVDVVLTYHRLRRGDTVILCSDGLTRVVGAGEVAAAAVRNRDVAAGCQDLIDLANHRGGPDNITVVAARFDGGGLAYPEPDERVVRQPYQLPLTV
jgi:PPM family protein phosphatase